MCGGRGRGCFGRWKDRGCSWMKIGGGVRGGRKGCGEGLGLGIGRWGGLGVIGLWGKIGMEM